METMKDKIITMDGSSAQPEVPSPSVREAKAWLTPHDELTFAKVKEALNALERKAQDANLDIFQVLKLVGITVQTFYLWRSGFNLPRRDKRTRVCAFLAGRLSPLAPSTNSGPKPTTRPRSASDASSLKLRVERSSLRSPTSTALERMAITLVGGDAAWATMSPDIQQLWLTKARDGLKSVGERIWQLESEREWLCMALQQIAYPRRGDGDITVERLTAIARAVLLERRRP
jgi:hypothetical protein